MLAIVKKGFVGALPEELHSRAPANSCGSKLPQETLQDFLSSHNSNSNVFSIGFLDKAVLAFAPPPPPQTLISRNHRWFSGIDDIYCIFVGNLNNLFVLLKQYGLPRTANEATFVMESYRVLRDRGPFPAHQMLRDLDGSFGFVVYDSRAGNVFAALGTDEKVKLFWGVGGDGSLLISDDLGIVKASCAKSYAPFPTGCMFHSEGGLRSFEHPMHKMKAMPRIDSEGVICGANFKPDTCTKITTGMPRVGSEANWPVWGQHA